MGEIGGKHHHSTTNELLDRVQKRILGLLQNMGQQAKSWEDFHLNMLAETLHAKIGGLSAALKIIDEELAAMTDLMPILNGSLGIFTVRPNFCPMCGLQRIWSLNDDRAWKDGRCFSCPCGFAYQQVDDFHLLAAAECVGGSMALVVDPGSGEAEPHDSWGGILGPK